MNYTTIPSEEVLSKTAEGIKAHNEQPIIVQTKEEALAKIKELIPAGASVTNGASKTLEAIGFIDYLKSGTHGWNNLHEKILEEKDPKKQTLLRRQMSVSDYYLGSVHALTEAGEILVASNTGSQLPSITFNSQNLIFVVGAQKIVPTLEDAFKRLHEHVMPLEDARMKGVYGPQGGTFLSKLLIYYGENASSKRTVTVIIVRESLGF